jgi:ABC-type branched-subunit amino acid transport system ATPase component
VRDDVGCGLLVIEHDMSVIMRLCERIQVLDHGRTISIGTPAAVRADEAVLTAYLGTRH